MSLGRHHELLPQEASTPLFPGEGMLPPPSPGGATNSFHSLESFPILSVSYISSAHPLRPRERLTSPYPQPLEAVRRTHLPLYSGEAPPLHSLDMRLPPSPGGDMLPPTSPGGASSSLCPWERCCPSPSLGETPIPFRPLEGQYISSAHPLHPQEKPTSSSPPPQGTVRHIHLPL